MENWEEIKGYEGLYSVSDLGRVKSLERRVSGRNYKSKILKNQKDRYGYEYVNIYYKCDNKRFYIHRLIALHFLSNTEGKECVNHIDGDKLNNIPSNLEWCTRAENNMHAIQNGLNNVFGENNVTHKYSDLKISEVKELYEKNIYTQKEISKITGVGYSSVNKIVNNKMRGFVGK